MPMLLFWFFLPDALIKVSNTLHLPLKCTCHDSVSRPCGLWQSTTAVTCPFVTELFNDICSPGLTILQGSENGMVHCEVGD